MEFIFIGLLIIAIIVLVVGLVRVISAPTNGFIDFIVHLLCIDFLIDLIAGAIKLIGSVLED
jgi:hypothetical protein